MSEAYKSETIGSDGRPFSDPFRLPATPGLKSAAEARQSEADEYTAQVQAEIDEIRADVQRSRLPQTEKQEVVEVDSHLLSTEPKVVHWFESQDGGKVEQVSGTWEEYEEHVARKVETLRLRDQS